MKLIGITGEARSGKDTIAKHLWAEYGFTRIAFADPLKLAAQQMFGLSHAQTWDDSLKEVVIPHWGMTPRKIFQLMGTEASKPVFGEDVWVKRWLMEPDRMLAEKDPLAMLLYAQYNQLAMPNMRLGETEVAALVGYLEEETQRRQVPSAQR